jgi:site-specific recombinase XerD
MIMPSLNFNLKLTVAKDYQIYAILRGRDIGILSQKKIYTGYNLPGDPKKFWDSGKQRVKNHPDAIDINKKMNTWSQRFDKYLEECRRYDRAPSYGEIIGLFENEAPQVRLNNLDYIFSLYIEKKGVTMKAATVRKYEGMKNYMLEYQSDRGNVRLSDVNEDFYFDFADWLITKHNNRNKTIYRKIKYIKTVMEFAVARDLTTNMKWRVRITSFKDADTHRGPLEREEIAALLKYRTTNLTDAKYLDAFLTACFSAGMRYSDLIQLKESHIMGAEGARFINLNEQKGLSDDSKPLPEFIYTRIKKYFRGSMNMFDWPKDGVLMGRALKKIFTELKLDRPIEITVIRGSKRESNFSPLHDLISPHWARYTYMRICDDLRMDKTDIQENVGHSSLAITEKYLITDVMNRVKVTNQLLESWG